MNDIEQHQQQEEAKVNTPGPLLKAAREAKGMTTQQVAQRLSLRRSVIEGIEADDYESNSSSTYLRGYVRNYARLVGVSEQQIVDALASIHIEDKPTVMQSFSKRTSKQQRDSRWMLITWVIALALIGLLVWWWLSKPQPLSELTSQLSLPAVEEQAQVTEPAAQPVLQQPTIQVVKAEPEATKDLAESAAPQEAEMPVFTEVETAAEPETSTADSQSSAPQISTPEVSEPVAEVIDTTLAAAEAQIDAPAEPVVAHDTLSLSLSGDCWMLVRDADGNTLVEGLKLQGYQTEISGLGPFKVKLGAPETVALSLNGKAVDMSSYRPGKVANLTLSN